MIIIQNVWRNALYCMPPGDSTVPRLFINTPKCSPFLVMSLRQLATLQYFLCRGWGWGGRRRRGRRSEARRGGSSALSAGGSGREPRFGRHPTTSIRASPIAVARWAATPELQVKTLRLPSTDPEPRAAGYVPRATCTTTAVGCKCPTPRYFLLLDG